MEYCAIYQMVSFSMTLSDLAKFSSDSASRVLSAIVKLLVLSAGNLDVSI